MVIAPPTRVFFCTTGYSHEKLLRFPSRRANDGRWQPLTGFIKVEIWRKSPLVQPGKGEIFGKTMWFFNPSLWFYDGDIMGYDVGYGLIILWLLGGSSHLVNGL
jgi:hypothetical protein